MSKKYIDLYEKITYPRTTTNDYRRGVIDTLGFLDRNPDQVPGRTITESSDRYVFDGASVLAVEFGRVVESDDGYLQPHPEFPDRHTITAMLKDGDHLPTVGAKDRITVIIEKADPEPTNAEKLAGIIAEKFQLEYRGDPNDAIGLGKYLDEAGVKAPGGEDD